MASSEINVSEIRSVDEQHPKPQQRSPLKAQPATVISAAPKIRNLQKELTELVPTTLRKRKLNTGNDKIISSSFMSVNAAPEVSIDNLENPILNESEKIVDRPNDPAKLEYEKFLSEMKGLI